LRSLPAGFHGFHIHEFGQCEPDASDGPFTSAGGHYNPGGTNHGGYDDQSHGHTIPHAGDMPSVLVGADGRAQLSFVTDMFTVAELRDVNGSAVMVHENADNFANIPDDRYSTTEGPGPDSTTKKTGDAGNRIACGVIGTHY
jgi:Cu-Zn family superoxide dismutase